MDLLAQPRRARAARCWADSCHPPGGVRVLDATVSRSSTSSYRTRPAPCIAQMRQAHCSRMHIPLQQGQSQRVRAGLGGLELLRRLGRGPECGASARVKSMAHRKKATSSAGASFSHARKVL